jgi:hypothetical protein
MTDKNLLSLPLFRELNACDTPEEILNKIRDPNLGFNQPVLSKWLISTVNILHALSATLGKVVGPVRLRKLNTTHSGMVV